MRVLRPLVLVSLVAACQGSSGQDGKAPEPSGGTTITPSSPQTPATPAAPANPGTPTSATPVSPASPTAQVAPPAATGSLTVVDASGGAGPYRIADLSCFMAQLRVDGATPGKHQVRVDVVSPEGSLYAQLPAPMTAEASGAGAATQRLQVDGTDIESLHRIGTWSFRAYLDGGPRPIATAEAQVTD
jgi:hypothetical protein